MITKFLRKRNPNSSGVYAKSFARIQVHANGAQTFKFKKILVGSEKGSIIKTESGLVLTTELSQRLIAD